MTLKDIDDTLQDPRWTGADSAEQLEVASRAFGEAAETIDDATERIAALRRELYAAQTARLAADLRAGGLQAAFNAAYRAHNTWCWALGQLRTLAEMAQDRIDKPDAFMSISPAFLAQETARIRDGVELLPEGLSPIPPDLAPLRNLVRELLAATNLPPGQRFPDGSPNRRLADALAGLLAAYPFLDSGAEPAGEVPRGE